MLPLLCVQDHQLYRFLHEYLHNLVHRNPVWIARHQLEPVKSVSPQLSTYKPVLSLGMQHIVTYNSIIIMCGNPQPEAIGHTRTCLQPESGASTMHSLQPCQLESDIQLHDQSEAAAQLCTAHYVSEEGVMCDASLIEYKQVFFLDEAHMATAHCFCRHPLGLQEFYVGISVLISGGPILLHAKNLCGLLDAHSPSLCRQKHAAAAVYGFV